jgi:gentisate 1,2-dioxygenase
VHWAAGDVVTLPGGGPATYRATEDALLYRVTDAPLLRWLGATPADRRFAPTRYDGVEADRRLRAVAAHPDAGLRNRVSILLGNATMTQTLTATPTLWAMLGILPVDAVQRPHRHQSAALDLIVACEPGCYTLVGRALGDDGSILDPVRVAWESAGAFVTPPGAWHSHHNESGAPARLFPVQDAGLHTYLRSLDIRFS